MFGGFSNSAGPTCRQPFQNGCWLLPLGCLQGSLISLLQLGQLRILTAFGEPNALVLSTERVALIFLQGSLIATGGFDGIHPHTQLCLPPWPFLMFAATFPFDHIRICKGPAPKGVRVTEAEAEVWPQEPALEQPTWQEPELRAIFCGVLTGEELLTPLFLGGEKYGGHRVLFVLVLAI